MLECMTRARYYPDKQAGQMTMQDDPRGLEPQQAGEHPFDAVRVGSPLRLRGSLLLFAFLMSLAGCKVGPDFTQPVASVAEQWLEASRQYDDTA